MPDRFVLIIMLVLATSSFVHAGPANPDPVDIIQPDGSSIRSRMRGDEFQGWTELEETGHTIIHNKTTGYWEYAEQATDGTLKGTGIAARSKGLNAPVKIPKGLKPPRNKDAEAQFDLMLKDIYQQRFNVSGTTLPDGSLAGAGNWLPAPVSGTRNMLVILVSFADQPIVTTPTSWNTAVFDTASKSVAKFYQDNSFGTLSISPISHTQSGNPAGVVSVTLASNHPNLGNNYTWASDQAWGNEALQQAATYVNFNVLDTNNNGILDASEVIIYFIVAGYEASSNSGLTPSVWAHAMTTTGTGLAAGTKNVQRWAQNGEYYNATTQMSMGVIAHELGHQIAGLPDLYDVSGQNQGMGEFSLMAGGSWGRDSGETSGTTPTALDAWSRIYLGWTSPVIPASGAAVSLPHALSSNTAAIKLVLPLASTTEYFLAENRYPIGWDLGLKGRLGAGWPGGMLLTHIDITAGAKINSYTLNQPVPGHQGVVPVQASTALCSMLNVGDTCRGHATTLFYSTNNANWTPSSSPNSNYYSGTATNLYLMDISAPSGVMTANLSMSAPAQRSISINKLGPGSGTVTAVSSTGGSFTCGGVCSGSFYDGSTVTLTAVADSGSAFTGWSGGECVGTGNCQFTLSSDTTVVAAFSPFVIISSENFSSCTPPGSWSIVDNAGSGAVWTFNDLGTKGNLTGGSGCFAIVDSDFAGGSVSEDTELRSPTYDLSSYYIVNLAFKTKFKRYGTEISDVDISVNGGSTWSNVWRKSLTDYSGSEILDISSIAAGRSNVMVRFHYYNAVWEWYWQIDDVVLSGVQSSLTFSFAGNGYGSVNSSPSGIACTGTLGSFCPAHSYTSGSNVTLTALPDSSSANYSTFNGWVSPCSVVNGNCSVTMSGPVRVTGTFTRDKLVKLSAQTGGTYGSILEACQILVADPTITDHTIQVRDNSDLTPFSDVLTINQDIVLKGGFSSGFGTNPGYTTTNGKLTVGSGGVLRVERIKIK